MLVCKYTVPTYCSRKSPESQTKSQTKMAFNMLTYRYIHTYRRHKAKTNNILQNLRWNVIRDYMCIQWRVQYSTVYTGWYKCRHCKLVPLSDLYTCTFLHFPKWIELHLSNRPQSVWEHDHQSCISTLSDKDLYWTHSFLLYIIMTHHLKVLQTEIQMDVVGTVCTW